MKPNNANNKEEDGYRESVVKSYLGLKTWETTGVPTIYLTVDIMYNLAKEFVKVNHFKKKVFSRFINFALVKPIVFSKS